MYRSCLGNFKDPVGVNMTSKMVLAFSGQSGGLKAMIDEQQRLSVDVRSPFGSDMTSNTVLACAGWKSRRCRRRCPCTKAPLPLPKLPLWYVADTS